MRAGLLLLTLLWSGWHSSAVVTSGGHSVFTVNGKPFFVYGAAFFYERTPRDEWRRDLEAYRAIGINTIDLYLMWNWHEPNPHTVDFDGRTNPRRNLHALFTIIHQLGLKAIVRPGPVIRNEWRNGGYPAWLLERPAYHMPLHDILEGRYPATATLQNAHADAAGAEWMANATHRYYARRWLRDVLHAIAPWSSDVIAIALDDDQGAYIDNDTWPAPHWRAYIEWLKGVVRSAVGPRVPLFINTYQMKVTAAAPVWAWGNWYQSDAYRIGAHDLAQLAFSTALLQTQPKKPVMASEFQAGWLQGADEVRPRAAAPENTTLALHQLLHFGARGVVNFPLQDTLNPAGYEAPWANWSYAWDAAFTLHGKHSPRYAPTAAFGDLVRRYGSILATLSPRADVSIAWLGSAYDPNAMTNARFAALASATIAALQRCRALAFTCRLVDLHYDSINDLERTPALVVPAMPWGPFEPVTRYTLRALCGRVTVHPTVDAFAHTVRSNTDGLRDAALLVTPDGRSGMLDIFNASTTTRNTPRVVLHLDGRRFVIPALRLPPGTARDIPLGLPPPAPLPRASEPLPAPEPLRAQFRHVPAHAAIVYKDDVFRDGSPTFVLDNGRVRVVVSADAGARSFVFDNLATHRNLFTTIGALRDDVAAPPTPSPRDYIAAYTHPFPTGTFNRHYDCVPGRRSADATLTCSYTAPDLAPTPVQFVKTFELAPGNDGFTVKLSATAPAVSISALVASGAQGYKLLRIPYGDGTTRWITFSTKHAPVVRTTPP